MARDTASAAAICGSYANLRIVQTRGVVQIIVEVPLEQAGAVTAALGWPQPGQERPVAIALLEPSHGPAER